MAQIGLFIMLGLLASPGDVKLYAVVVALLAGLFLTFVARPVSVWVCAVGFGIPLRHQVFLSWAGLRGAVPIVLATIPLSEKVPDSAFLFDVVLVFVIVFTCLQAPTLPLVGRRLGLLDDRAASELDVEVAPLDRILADLLQVRVPAGSRLAGVEIGELRLPQHTVVTLIIRDGEPFNPAPRERIRAEDELLIVTPTAQREVTEDRLRAIGRSGRLARWRDGERAG
jgi:cell volume regulation protein A